MSALGDYGRYASLGISWVLATAVYLYLGYRAGRWLDGRLGSEPVFFVLGIVLGMVLSMLSLVKEVVALQQPGGISAPPGGKRGSGRDRENGNFPEGDPRPRQGGSPPGKDDR
ncbi:MAG: AtpZ/AtpI family protein [Firmicutes bacterium]|nr:AtpZ/AtpI family protein [Bacillota bacterium]